MKLLTRIKAAAQIVANNIGLALPELLLDPGSYRGEPFGKNFWMFDVGGVDYYFSFNEPNSSLKAFTKCPPVGAIVTRKAQAYVNGKTWILNRQGKAKAKEATSETAVKIRRLLTQPNILQSGKQFESQAYMYQQLYGYAVVIANKPFGFPMMDASSMWLLPNWMLEIEESEDFFYDKNVQFIKRIFLKYKNKKRELPLENIFILKDFRPSFTSAILPSSRIQSLEMPINNIIGAYESRNILINKRGPSGILSNAAKDVSGTIPMTPDMKEEAQKDFMQYGLRRSQMQAIITNATLNWQSMGFNVQELGLFEEVVDSAKAICDGFGYPPHLLGLIDPTFNNQSAALKWLYQDIIIPESLSNYEQWNALFKTDELNLIIEKDYSDLPALQEDKKDQATARSTLGQALDREFKNNWITYNRVLELLGEDTLAWGDIYYRQMVDAGFVFGNANQQLVVDASGNIITQQNQ